MSNCISDITLIGWVTKDPEVYKSQKTGKNFGKITIAINKSFPNELTNYYSCFFDDAQLDRIQKAGVKKGSLIKVVGEFTHRVYEKTDQNKQPTGDHGFDLRVIAWNWDYIPSSGKKNGAATSPGNKTKASDQGAKPKDSFDDLPVDNLDEDDDLPF